MAISLQEFLDGVHPAFKGQAQAVGDAIGSDDLDEIIENLSDRSDLSDLDAAGFKKLHVNMLHKAVNAEKERRGLAEPLPTKPMAQLSEPVPQPMAPISEVQEEASNPSVALVPPKGRPVREIPKLEKTMSTVPEDSIKEPKAEVVVKDRSRHSSLGELAVEASSTEEPAVDLPKEMFPALKPEPRRGLSSRAQALQRAEQAARLAQLAAETAKAAAAEAAGQDEAEACNATVARGVLEQKKAAAGGAAPFALSKLVWRRSVQFMWDRDQGAFLDLDQALVGPLLGKAGTNKVKIELSSGAKLVVMDAGPDVRTRVQMLGSWDQREKARRLIDECLSNMVHSSVFYKVVNLQQGQGKEGRPGICYSRSKESKDIDWSAMARWGTSVQGTEDGEFLKLDPWYLPTKINGQPVLQREGDTTWRVDNSQLKSQLKGIEYKYWDDMKTGFLAKWGDRIKGSDEGDGWFKLDETWYLQMAQKDKFELRKFDPKGWCFGDDPHHGHPSNLSEKDFRAQIEEAIGEGEGSVEDVFVFEPKPKLRKETPNVVMSLTSQEAADKLRAQREMEILGQRVRVCWPDHDKVCRAESSRGGTSEAPSDGASVAGSLNSHTSVQSHRGERQLMTLLFAGLPESVCNSDTQKPAAKNSIKAFVDGIVKDAPVNEKSYSVSASFTVPKKAPLGGCWVNFQYEVENCRINPDDGKSYTLEAFKKVHQGTIDMTEGKVMAKWNRCREAVQVLEKQLNGNDGPRMSIATWFMNAAKKKDPPVQVSGSPKLLVKCDGIKGTFSDGKLSVQWKRAA